MPHVRKLKPPAHKSYNTGAGVIGTPEMTTRKKDGAFDRLPYPSVAQAEAERAQLENELMKARIEALRADTAQRKAGGQPVSNAPLLAGQFADLSARLSDLEDKLDVLIAALARETP